MNEDVIFVADGKTCSMLIPWYSLFEEVMNILQIIPLLTAIKKFFEEVINILQIIPLLTAIIRRSFMPTTSSINEIG